jgi:hypothetical protein
MILTIGSSLMDKVRAWPDVLVCRLGGTLQR